MAWHLDGMSLDRYCTLTWRDRAAVHAAVDQLIEATNPEEGSGNLDGMDRPKRWRK